MVLMGLYASYIINMYSCFERGILRKKKSRLLARLFLLKKEFHHCFEGVYFFGIDGILDTFVG
jgi:hypothetical protein